MSPRRPAYEQFRSYKPPFGDIVSIYARHRLSKRACHCFDPCECVCVCVRVWVNFNKIEVVS